MESYGDWRLRTLKVFGKGRRKIGVTGSWGVYDAYKAIRKDGWQGIGRPLMEHEFYAIVRGMNDLLAERLALGETITFPARMGRLLLTKRRPSAYMDKGGRLKVTYPVDWDSTLKLWFEDAEAEGDKVLVRRRTGFTYRVRYDKSAANYPNKIYYEFALNRFIKRRLKKNIDDGAADTIW